RGVGDDVDRLVLALVEHPVGGVEGPQVEVVGHAGAEQLEEVLEHLGHEVPGGPGVEPEATRLPGPGSPAECGLLLEEVHLVPLRGQERGGGEPGDAAADDRGAAGHRAVTTLRATMPALTRSGTRTRVRAMSQA